MTSNTAEQAAGGVAIIDLDRLTPAERASRADISGSVAVHGQGDFQAVLLDGDAVPFDRCAHRHRTRDTALRCATRGVAAWQREFWPDWGAGA